MTLCCYDMKLSKSTIGKQSVLHTLSQEEESMDITDFESCSNRSTNRHAKLEGIDRRRSTRSNTSSSFFHLQMGPANIIQG